MSSQNSEHSTLDECAWSAVCKKASGEAQRDCGLSYDYRCELFSSAIDVQVEKLPVEQRARALEIAREDWDYLTLEERLEARQWNAENGCCTHGITLGCCPAGCGS